MRARVHVGLAVLLVIAPALCCCSVRTLTGLVVASVALPGCPSCADDQAPPPAPSCCHSEKAKPAKKSCCQQAAPGKKPEPKPAPQPGTCCLDQRPDAAPPEAGPTVADPQPTGELLPLTHVGLADVSPEHLGLVGGLDPPERAGVDTRSAALFDRHTLRC
jgi:hypothetical protein